MYAGIRELWYYLNLWNYFLYLTILSSWIADRCSTVYFEFSLLYISFKVTFMWIYLGNEFSNDIEVHYKVKLYLQKYLHFTKYEWKKWYWIILWAIGLSLDNRVKFPHKAAYFFPEVLDWPKSSFVFFHMILWKTWMNFLANPIFCLLTVSRW